MRRITIVGLGLIGSSLGMALRQTYGKKNLEIVGHDSNRTTAKKAQKMLAVDRITGNLMNAVQDAQMVILATPVMAIRDLMERIGHRLMDGCIVTDTSNVKQVVLGWADTYLPQHVNFIGGNPLVTGGTPGIEGAKPVLFQNTLYCLCPSPRARRDAVEVVAEMIKKLGARPYYINSAEHDSYAAATHQLPLILSSALVGVTFKTDSWRDMGKQADLSFEEMSRLAAADPLDNLDACITNKEALLHWLDKAINELIDYRHLLEKDAEGLGRTFTTVSQAREQWLRSRAAGFPEDERHQVPFPNFGERMGAFLVGEKLMERYRRIEEGWQSSERNRPRRARE